jgi:hypothetical protein
MLLPMKAVKGITFFCVFLLAHIFISCSNLMGYGVILWSIPEENLYDGDIVPVYIKSNINEVYVIGIPGTDRKIELPLWQITDPVSKKDAEKNALRFQEYKGVYALVKEDGLIVRNEPTNTGRQIYRLKQDEIIKVLYKGKGAPVANFEGDWLRVIMQDGTIGWRFSYNLTLFNESEGIKGNTVVEEVDEVLESVLKTRWYPESYQTMIRNNTIDIEAMNPSHGFITGAQSKITELIMPSFSLSYSYEGVQKIDKNVYEFINTPLTMTIKNASAVVIQYKDSSGKPYSYSFTALADNPADLISAEKSRRQVLFNALLSSGPSYSSSNYGVLQFIEGNSFLWTGYSLLSPSVIPSGAGSRGKVELKYFLGKELSFVYDGILSLSFDSRDEEICFFYKLEETGLRLEHLPFSLISNNTAERQSSNPLVMFFAR